MTPASRALAEGSLITSIEPRLGVPTFLWSSPPALGGTTFRTMGLTAEQAARRYLVAHAELYRASPRAWAEATAVHVHDLRDHGAVVVAFQQRVHGVRVFRDEVKVIMTPELELVALSGYLTPELKVRGAFSLSESSALLVAVQALSGRGVEATALGRFGVDGAGFTLFRVGTEPTPARVRPVYFPLADGIAPAFQVEVELGRASTDSLYESFIVSAVDGAVLLQKNLTAADSFDYRVYADTSSRHLPTDGPQGTIATPHPTGQLDGFNPGFFPPELVSVEHGPISTNDPWLAPGATGTAGNNVRAYADLAAPNGFSAGDLMGAVSAPGQFDRVYDPTIDPNANATQQQAVITQLFYDTNFFHDWYYDVGFDEKAGNAQASNLGRGGVQGDALQAEAQDNSGRNNANMSTPSDGASPRMQMYIFDGASTGGLSVATAPAQTFAVEGATFGPQSFTVSGELALAQSGTSALACTAITNAVSGKIALVDRGTCTFAQKAQAAQAAGAAGVIIMDNVAGSTPPSLQGNGSVTIPTLSVTKIAGQSLRALPSGTTATISRLKKADADGDVDNAIVAHEWGHYISNRLIGDGNGLSNNQAVGMGEGWADFHSMLLLVREEDTLVPTNASWNGVYGMAAYTSAATNPQGYYFGIRRVPYSTDLTKNGLTFKHIQDGVRLPSGVPTAFGLGGSQNSEVHATGEVWATMLWECYAGLLRDPRFTFLQAQDRMRAYLVAAYKATPLMPTFVDARDAMLAVVAAKDPQDYATFWTAFAKRGLGMGAVAPDRDSPDNSPAQESFIVGNAAAITGVALDDATSACDHDGTLDAKESGLLSVTVKNVGIGALTAATLQVGTATQGLTMGGSGPLTLPALAPFASATVKIPVSLGDVKGVTPALFTLSVTDPSLVGAPVTKDAAFRMNFDVREKGATVDDVEAPMTQWTAASDPNGNTGSDFRRFETSATDHSWFGPDPSSPADTWLISPALNVGSGDFTITFRHRFDFETDPNTGDAYDGAVIEVSSDDGASWSDVGAKATPGYTGTLYAGSGNTASSNPLAGSAAYVGKSAGYPAMVGETVNLGTSYAGQTVRFRFRIGADDAAAAKGWELDDIAFVGITNTPFTTVVSDPNLCFNKAPSAAVSDQEVSEGDAVTLTATTSDPDGDAVTQAWVQTGGPLVKLTGPTFTAPTVDVDTTLSFALTVSDGRAVVGPFTKNVLVKNVNRPPVASAPEAIEVAEGTSITVSGSGSDPEGSAVTFAWSQDSGPAVTLDGATMDTVTLTAPWVKADATVVLALAVTDAQGVASAPARVTVTVKNTGTVDGRKGCGCSGTEGLFGSLGVLGLGLLRPRRKVERPRAG